MACLILAVLATCGAIDPDALARSFATRPCGAHPRHPRAGHHDIGPHVGVEHGAARRRRALSPVGLTTPTAARAPPSTACSGSSRQEDRDWRKLYSSLFNGQSSWGNGPAMRVAPLGAWSADDVERAVRQADLSAAVSHRHPEGIAPPRRRRRIGPGGGPGWPRRPDGPHLRGDRPSLGRRGPQRSPAGPRPARPRGRRWRHHCRRTRLRATHHRPRHRAVRLWAAARHLDDSTAALRTTARAGGDVDTTCTLVGGIPSSRPAGEPPSSWLGHTGPLPAWLPNSLTSC
jgi:hypothetical protein